MTQAVIIDAETRTLKAEDACQKILAFETGLENGSEKNLGFRF